MKDKRYIQNDIDFVSGDFMALIACGTNPRVVRHAAMVLTIVSGDMCLLFLRL